MQILSRFMGKETPTEAETARKKLLEEYADAQRQLRRSRASFEAVTDPDLISACIYEVNAAQSRCSFLLGLIREQESSQPGMIQ